MSRLWPQHLHLFAAPYLSITLPGSCIAVVGRAISFCTDHIGSLYPEGVFAMSAMEDFATAEADHVCFRMQLALMLKHWL